MWAACRALQHCCKGFAKGDALQYTHSFMEIRHSLAGVVNKQLQACLLPTHPLGCCGAHLFSMRAMSRCACQCFSIMRQVRRLTGIAPSLSLADSSFASLLFNHLPCMQHSREHVSSGPGRACPKQAAAVAATSVIQHNCVAPNNHVVYCSQMHLTKQSQAPNSHQIRHHTPDQPVNTNPVQYGAECPLCHVEFAEAVDGLCLVVATPARAPWHSVRDSVGTVW